MNQKSGLGQQKPRKGTQQVVFANSSQNCLRLILILLRLLFEKKYGLEFLCAPET